MAVFSRVFCDPYDGCRHKADLDDLKRLEEFVRAIDKQHR
jgi:hypothetical protein